MSFWRCPVCGGDDLEVLVAAWAELRQTPWNGTTEVETELGNASDNDHEWSRESSMLCGGCGRRGKAGEFERTDPPDGCLGLEGREAGEAEEV